MCLAIPGRIVEIVDDARDLAKVEFSGVRRTVNITLVRQDGAGVGAWVLVHVGFALRMINEEEAAETLRYLAMIGREFQEEIDQIAGSAIADGTGAEP
jgi:hydrogenase expression/formation protein HypC